MKDGLHRPLVGVSTCVVRRGAFDVHQAGAKYIQAVREGAQALPVLLPAGSDPQDLEQVVAGLDGLLLTGSPSNIEPHHYDGPPPPADNLTDPARDAATLPLIPLALACGVPLLAVCRGIQELNVALGGTLHQEVHDIPGRWDHRSDKTLTPEDRYRAAHEIDLTPGGVLQDLLGGGDRIAVNSLHGQAIDRLAPGLEIEAMAADGTIEAVSVRSAPAFALGVQWHPEYRVLENPVSARIFAAFGAACRMCAKRRSGSGDRREPGHDRDRTLAARA